MNDVLDVQRELQRRKDPQSPFLKNQALFHESAS